jgi:hypothetical protein
MEGKMEREKGLVPSWHLLGCACLCVPAHSDSRLAGRASLNCRLHAHARQWLYWAACASLVSSWVRQPCRPPSAPYTSASTPAGRRSAIRLGGVDSCFSLSIAFVVNRCD